MTEYAAIAETPTPKFRSCQGCVHFWEYRGRCGLGRETRYDKYADAKYELNVLSVSRARAEGGICGPDASKYDPGDSLLTKIRLVGLLLLLGGAGTALMLGCLWGIARLAAYLAFLIV